MIFTQSVRFTTAQRTIGINLLSKAFFVNRTDRQVFTLPIFSMTRAVTNKSVNLGGAYSYIRVLPDEFLLKSTVMTTDFKRNSSGRTRIYKLPPNQRFSYGPVYDKYTC